MADEKDPTQPIYDPEGPDDIDRRMDVLEHRLGLFLDEWDYEKGLFRNESDHSKSEIDDPDPTRTNIIKTHRSGETVEMEWDSIHSVEITRTTKEGPRVSKVKVYDADPMAAARVAAALFAEASSQLARVLAADSPPEDAEDKNPEEPGQ